MVFPLGPSPVAETSGIRRGGDGVPAVREAAVLLTEALRSGDLVFDIMKGCASSVGTSMLAVDCSTFSGIAFFLESPLEVLLPETYKVFLILLFGSNCKNVSTQRK